MKVETREKLIRIVTWLARLIVGGTFIFSGMVKGIDPWGTYYKLYDYINAMGLNFSQNIILSGDFILFSAEFLIGIFILLGCMRRTAPILMILFMVVMLPLTLWIAIKNPVADCGCFGDALILSNWATFWKNIVLTALGVWLLKFNLRCRCLIDPYIQWIALTVSTIFVIIIALIGYLYQPLIDFRPYKESTPLADIRDPENNDLEDTSYESYTFVYEKDGVIKEFGLDDELPDEEDGWTFVERKEGNIPHKEHPTHNAATTNSENNFRIWSENGEEDVTNDVIVTNGPQLLLMMPDLADVSTSTSWIINSLYSWAEHNNINMIAVVSGSQQDINRWKDLSLSAYDIYTADDTQIKEVVRGNPALVYTENDTIIWKSTLASLNTDDFLAPDTTTDPRSYHRDNSRIFKNLCLIYLATMIVLIFCSFSPTLSRFFLKKRKINHDDTALH